MYIPVSWKMRLRDGPHGSSAKKNAGIRPGYVADDRMSKRPPLPKEEDLDHLGRLHKTHH